jgi:hypoxanthine phosphoribosyltransferase
MPALSDISGLPEGAELLVTAAAVNAAVEKVANAIAAVYPGKSERPLALVVMRGGLIFAGHLLPLLPFSLDIDYVDATRYGTSTRGGELNWRAAIPDVRGRVVLLIDDILDEGLTLAAIRKKLLNAGAAEVLIAVFAEKDLSHAKPVAADFVGVALPNRYVFGFGMDVRGLWRNLPAVYALAQDQQD